MVYSGVYHKRPEAEKALAGLSKSFPGAKVISVSNGGSGSNTGSSGASGKGGVGASPTHPAPPTALKGLEKAKGKSYEEQSRNLPNVVETG